MSKPLAEMAMEWLRDTFGMEDRWDGQPWDDKDAASLTALLERVAGEASEESEAQNRYFRTDIDRLQEKAADAQKEIERLKVSMLSHFQREHLEGDGPEIDRWKLKLERAEAATRPLVEALRMYHEEWMNQGHLDLISPLLCMHSKRAEDLARAALAAHEERSK